MISSRFTNLWESKARATEARTPRNVIISYMFAKLWESASERAELDLSEVLSFHTDSRNMRIQAPGRPKLEPQEMWLVQTSPPNYESQQNCASQARYARRTIISKNHEPARIQSPCGRSWNSKKCYNFTHILQIIRINRTVRAQASLPEVQSFHTDSRNYENPKPWRLKLEVH